VIEGLGPPPEILAKMRVPAWQRLRGWIEQMQSSPGASRTAIRRSTPPPSACSRRIRSCPRSRRATSRSTRVARNEDGTYTWKFDNYTRGFAPERFGEEEVFEMRKRITCPTLLVRGTESWARDPAVDGRAAPFANARSVNVEGAGTGCTTTG
jgi:pimeloyl-ACP methyl ester carboxylesterase